MMKALFPLVLLSLVFLGACAGKKYDEKMIEKYPACYHLNVKIYKKCIEKNEKGEKVTAMELENGAHPGQYN